MDDDYKRAVADLTSVDTERIMSMSTNGAGGALPMNPLHDVQEPPSSTPPANRGTDPDTTNHPSGIVPTLQNIVATCSLGCALDLKRIAQHARNAEYNPKRFAAVIMRIREPKTTALIFSSGKMVCTGAKSEQDSRLASRKFAKIVMKLGYSVTFQEFKIQNIVGSCDVMFPIGLEQLNFKHSLFTRYEPELFPGLIYKMKSPKVVLLIFVSGKVVLTGAKKRIDIYQAFEIIYPALWEFRKTKRKPMQAPLPVPVPDEPNQTPFTPPSTVNYDQSIRSDDRSEGRFSPVAPSLGILDYPSAHPSFSSDRHSAALLNQLHSPALMNPLHSPFSPRSQVAASGNQVQESPSTSLANPPATPLVHLFRPPTPQGNQGQ